MDTSESLSVLFFLYATTGGSGQRICNLGSFSIGDQCLRSMCAMYLVLLLYVMGKIGWLLVLGVVCMLSSSSCVLYFSALLKAVIMVSYLYPR